jgi:hypothetical protein
VHVHVSCRNGGPLDIRATFQSVFLECRKAAGGPVNGDHASFTPRAVPLHPENKINRL